LAAGDSFHRRAQLTSDEERAASHRCSQYQRRHGRVAVSRKRRVRGRQRVLEISQESKGERIYEIIGKPYDLQQIVSAVKQALGR
jgi:hypothetical protein